MDISRTIVKVRKQQGFTQESLADATNLSLSTIQRIEKGKVVPRPHTLKTITQVLGIELTNLPPISEAPKSNASDLSLFLQASYVLTFIPPLNIIFLFSHWMKNRTQDLTAIVLKKILNFQIKAFITLLLLVFLTPLVSYFLLGQKTVGQINIPLYAYLCYVVATISASSFIYRQSSIPLLSPSKS